MPSITQIDLDSILQLKTSAPSTGCVRALGRTSLLPRLQLHKEGTVAVASRRLDGMRGFILICFGQVVSLLGTSMTGFAIAVWGWRLTGSATALSLLIFFSIAPAVLLGPVAGAIVDRANRRHLMILADAGAALSTAALLLLYNTGSLQIWHVYVANLWAGMCQTLQTPAYSAAITMLVPKEHYGRANGLLSLVSSLPEVAAPLVAGVLVLAIGAAGIMVIDLLTFAFAVAMVAVVHIPQPVASVEGSTARGSLWSESAFGFRYIVARPGLLGVQLVFLAVNLALAFQWALQSPLILARTGQDTAALGAVLSALSIGSVAGGFVMTAWGGPKHRIHGVLGGLVLSSLLGLVPMGLARAVPVWALAGFLLMFFVPITNGANQALWQAKVAPDLQGRVFGVRRSIARLSYLVGFLVAGPLADRVFEPGMQGGGALAGAFGPAFGNGQGAGISLLMAICGVLGAGLGLAGYLVPAVRNVELAIPDHDAPRSPSSAEPGGRKT